MINKPYELRCLLEGTQKKKKLCFDVVLSSTFSLKKEKRKRERERGSSRSYL